MEEVEKKEYVKEITTDLGFLSKRCDEVDVKKENNIVKDIVLSLKRTLKEHEKGIGLAANQIGESKRIFIINYNGDMRSYINPVITQVENININREGCLSLPNKQYLIPRYGKIKIMYQNPLGKIESVQLIGMAAYVFQHELDHLDGINISDIGLEIDENFDKATEEERLEVVKAYMESLDLKSKKAIEEIDKDPELKQIKDAANFMADREKGNIKTEINVLDEETTNKIKEKVKGTNNVS